MDKLQIIEEGQKKYLQQISQHRMSERTEADYELQIQDLEKDIENMRKQHKKSMDRLSEKHFDNIQELKEETKHLQSKLSELKDKGYNVNTYKEYAAQLNEIQIEQNNKQTEVIATLKSMILNREEENSKLKKEVEELKIKLLDMPVLHEVE